DLFFVDLRHRAMIDPEHTVSRRTLTLEHAQHRLSFFFEELAGARIREAPQLPVVWQKSPAIGNPLNEQPVEKTGLGVSLERPVKGVSGEAMNVEWKPLQ